MTPTRSSGWTPSPSAAPTCTCGRCRFCREGRYGQCLGGGGWILGHKIDGTQAEYVRVPFADTSTYPMPPGASDEQILMLADILPTGYEVGVLNGGGSLTEGLGADVTIEAVGVPATFELAVKLARPGGRIANIGVHGEAATLHLEEQWIRDITVTTGLVDTYSTPTLLRLVTTSLMRGGS